MVGHWIWLRAWFANIDGNYYINKQQHLVLGSTKHVDFIDKCLYYLRLLRFYILITFSSIDYSTLSFRIIGAIWMTTFNFDQQFGNIAEVRRRSFIGINKVDRFESTRKTYNLYQKVNKNYEVNLKEYVGMKLTIKIITRKYSSIEL